MVHRASHILRLHAALLAVVAFPVAGLPLHGQAPPPAQPAQFDPSDVYFQAYLAVRAAEQLERDEDFPAAMEKLEQAAKLFETVRQFYPDWQPGMIAGRAEKTAEMLEAVRPKAEARRMEQRAVIAELEGGIRVGGNPGDSEATAPGILGIDPLAARQLSEAEREVERLRNLIADSKITESEASRNASRLRDLERARNDSQERLRAAEAQLHALRGRLAASPVENELNGLNQRIEALEHEREAMIMALNQSRDQHTRAMASVATLEADLRAMATQAAEMRQKEADLQRDLTTEREVASEVVDGQRRQLADLERKLEEKNVELAEANERIAGLQLELRQTRESFAELRDERDGLIRERDHMAALLQLSEEGRIQQLIEQNMGLAKDLREANERVERLSQESNADKDAVVLALRDLAVAKNRINDLQAEKRRQDTRIAELELRLRNEENALAGGQATSDPAEAELLRDIIRRQLRVQERRRQARDLLVKAVQELGSEDESVASAIKMLDGEEIHLTPEEQRVLADRQVDGEFISPFARDRASVGQATADLNRELESYNRAAERAFVSGRLLPTRELFQMMVEMNPGHTPALCKLGVVHLRLNDFTAASETFRRAVELDENNPYAHRMLGFSLYHLGDAPSAEEFVRRGVELMPEDASGHSLLAAITYQLGRPEEAEEHYEAAIQADPMPSEPYFNLALLCVRQGRLEEAREHYLRALERGALPDPDLEQRIHPQ